MRRGKWKRRMRQEDEDEDNGPAAGQGAVIPHRLNAATLQNETCGIVGGLGEYWSMACWVFGDSPGETPGPLRFCPSRPEGNLGVSRAATQARLAVPQEGGSLAWICVGRHPAELPRGARKRRQLNAWHHPGRTRSTLDLHRAEPRRAQESGDSCTPISAQCTQGRR